MKISIPYIYKKIAAKLNENGGTINFNEFQKQMVNTRITKSDCRKLIKDLQKHGIVTLEAKKVNQHLKIKVCSKGYAKLYVLAFSIMLGIIAYEIGAFTILLRCCG